MCSLINHLPAIRLQSDRPIHFQDIVTYLKSDDFVSAFVNSRVKPKEETKKGKKRGRDDDDEEGKSKKPKKEDLEHQCTSCVEEVFDDDRSLEEIQRESTLLVVKAPPNSVESGFDLSEEQLQLNINLSLQCATGVRHISVLNAYNTGRYLLMYQNKVGLNLSKVVEKLDQDGLGKDTAATCTKFAKVIDDAAIKKSLDVFKFLYICREPWYKVRKFLKQYDRKEKGVVGNCVLSKVLDSLL